MAGVEFGRPSEHNARESVLLKEYRTGIQNQVLAIHKRVDEVVAKKIGFDGNIFETVKQHISEVDKRFSMDRRMPLRLSHHISMNDYGNDMFEYADEDIVYRIDQSYMQTVSMFSKNGKLEFVMDAKEPKDIKARTEDATTRTIEFPQKFVTQYEAFRIGKRKGEVAVAPLVYGNLDKDGNGALHLDQGIYANGQHVNSQLDKENNGLVLSIRNIKFHFPLRVNPQHELMEVAARLGV